MLEKNDAALKEWSTIIGALESGIQTILQLISSYVVVSDLLFLRELAPAERLVSFHLWSPEVIRERFSSEEDFARAREAILGAAA